MVSSGTLSERVILALRAAAADRPLSIFVDPTLVDPLREDPTCKVLVEAALSKGAIQIVKLPRIHDNFDPDRQPYLLHVPSEANAEPLFNACVQVAMSEASGAYGEAYKARSVCAWIGGDNDPNATALALAQSARVVKPNGAPWYLRFWDPRVTWHLHRALQSASWVLHLSEGSAWHFILPTGDLSVLGNELVSHAQATAPHRLDAESWASLERIGAINTVFGLSGVWGVEPTSTNAARVDGLIKRCLERGFGSERDLLVFASCGLTSHLHFDMYPPVDAALRSAAAEQRSVQSALGEFDESTWTELRSGQWQVNEKASST